MKIGEAPRGLWLWPLINWAVPVLLGGATIAAYANEQYGSAVVVAGCFGFTFAIRLIEQFHLWVSSRD